MPGLGEIINLTILPGAGIAFADFDATRRLTKMGFELKKPGRKWTTKSRVQREFLNDRGIRDMGHYRVIVKDPLSVGPIHWYDPGQTLLMQRTVTRKKQKVFYLILDTAIGAQEEFIEELLSEKRIRIEEVDPCLKY